MFLFISFLIFSGALAAAAYYVWTIPNQQSQDLLTARLRELRMTGGQRSQQPASDLVRREQRGQLAALGDVYVYKNQMKEGLDAYTRASAIAPENGDTYYNIARVEQALGDTKAQGTAAQEAITKGTQMVGEA